MTLAEQVRAVGEADPSIRWIDSKLREDDMPDEIEEARRQGRAEERATIAAILDNEATLYDSSLAGNTATVLRDMARDIRARTA